MKILIFLLAASLGWNTLYAQSKPLTRAHAHNDYEHIHPLKDALSCGFTSVEADVYLIGNELFVAHKQPTQPDSMRTLRKLYLDPLQKLVQANHGSVYPHFDGVFYLMIDVKNDSLNTYHILKQQMAAYPEILNNKHFKIYLTSFEDLHFVLKDPAHLAGIDGRITDLGKGYTASQMPVVSEAFKTITQWDGKTPVTDKQYGLVKVFIDHVHADGKKSRLWAIPDDLSTWRRLFDMGMDFINTDKLEDLSVFLNGTR